jgi:hypothetical protein
MRSPSVLISKERYVMRLRPHELQGDENLGIAAMEAMGLTLATVKVVLV